MHKALHTNGNVPTVLDDWLKLVDLDNSKCTYVAEQTCKMIKANHDQVNTS